jgi:16S rRNA processing protein RimM
VTRARPHLLTLGATVTIGGRTAKIARRAGADRRPIVRLADVTDRADAEALHGQPLSVEARDAPTLAEDEYWAHQLEGCMVLDGSRRIGTVVRVIELPSCEALEVRVLPADAAPAVRTLTVGEAPDAHAVPTGEPEAPEARALPAGEALLIPMVKDAIRSIDLEGARIEVNMSFIEG